MRLGDEQVSTNVEDRRGQRGRRGGFRVPMGRRGGGSIGLGTIVILGIMWLVFGINPLEMLSGGMAPQTQQPQTQYQQDSPVASDEMGKRKIQATKAPVSAIQSIAIPSKPIVRKRSMTASAADSVSQA